MADQAAPIFQTAYYYPEPYWHLGEMDWIKTLLLFFDEVAILRPRYMEGIERIADPILAAPLQDRGLLRVLEPEDFVDRQMTESLSILLRSTSASHPNLDRDNSA